MGESGKGAEIDIPEVVASRARSVGARWWLDGLADLVAELCAEWGLEPVDRPCDGGTEALVTPVVADGVGPAVLRRSH